VKLDYSKTMATLLPSAYTGASGIPFIRRERSLSKKGGGGRLLSVDYSSGL
jgi:hypothetical protein